MRNYSLIFFIIYCCLYLTGCHNYSNKVAQVLSKKCSDNNRTIINISELTNYQWDRLYIFFPYWDGESIQKVVGQDFLTPGDWKEISKYSVNYGIQESDTMFVFLNNGNVVDHFIFWRVSGDFEVFKGHNSCFDLKNRKYAEGSFAYTERDNYACFSREDAKFIKENGELKIFNNQK